MLLIVLAGHVYEVLHGLQTMRFVHGDPNRSKKEVVSAALGVAVPLSLMMLSGS